MTATTSAVTLEEKLENLEEILRSLGRVLVGYSGGVDSAMLAVAAHRVLGDDAIAVTAVSESLGTGELEAAADICKQFGIRHEVLNTHELENPEYAKNPSNRCYFCKHALLTEMEQLARDLEIPHVIYGQNADDEGDFRPGAQAAKERGARAPLAEVGITKDEIRQLARSWDIPVWNRPAMACLSSRFPYGTAITAEGLRMVDRAEHYLRDICGFAQMRARHHVDIARVELPSEDLSSFLADATKRNNLLAEFADIGFAKTSVDLRGFRSGSMNEVLTQIDLGEVDVPKQIDRILTDLELGPITWEQREQMLVLQLPEATFSRLADAAFRLRLVERLENLDLHYIALNLQPLQN